MCKYVSRMPLNPTPTIKDHTISGNIKDLNFCRTISPTLQSALKERPLNMANSGMWNAKIKPLVVLRLGKFDCMMCPHITRKMANAFKKSIQSIRLTKLVSRYGLTIFADALSPI